jgi:hypothetical protein
VVANSTLPDDLKVIVPNLHRRYTGVTATNRMVAPKLAKLVRAAWFGTYAPDGIARMSINDLLKLWRRRTPLVWHARRNNEMIAGVLLRALGWPLKLLFTSAAQRHHTWITRWLIRRMDAVIVLVGAVTPEQAIFAGDLRKRIEAAGLASRIVITGELAIEEVQRWYQRLTIYAFASRNEGFGLTLIEAMGAGAALVASRAGAAELVVEDGVTGVLVPIGDVDALVAALEPLMRDPASANMMGARARQRVVEKFSLDAEAAAIAGVYRTLV